MSSTSTQRCIAHAARLILLTAALQGCSATEDGPESTDVAQSSSLPAPTVLRVDPPALDADQQRRQREVEQYIADRYREQGWRVVETTQTYVGDIIDWLDPASVPGSQIPQPPKPSPEELRLPPGVQLGLTELELYPELRGPEGTIPMHRPTFARYVLGEAEATSVEDFIRRYQVPGMPAGQNRLYAGYSKKVQHKAASSYVTAFGGTIEAGTLTLLEMAVVDRGPTPSTTHEQVGIAIGRDRANMSDSLVRLRVEFMTMGDDVAGDYKGGWDGMFWGFVPAAGRPYPPNTVLTGVSTIGGIQYEHQLHIELVAGNWWVAHNGNWLGYYPGWLFNLINNTAAEALWYGEVYDPTPTNWTWTDMGSGMFASAGYMNASYFRNPIYSDIWGNWQWADGASGVGPRADACYTRSIMFSGAPPSDRYFRLGGPGGEAPGCD